MKPSIDSVWMRIERHQGDNFETVTGKPFTYEVSGQVLRTSRTKYSLSRSNFEKALKYLPIGGPGEISDLVRGSAYVWAILHDQRIRQLDW